MTVVGVKAKATVAVVREVGRQAGGRGLVRVAVAMALVRKVAVMVLVPVGKERVAPLAREVFAVQAVVMTEGAAGRTADTLHKHRRRIW